MSHIHHTTHKHTYIIYTHVPCGAVEVASVLLGTFIRRGALHKHITYITHNTQTHNAQKLYIILNILTRTCSVWRGRGRVGSARRVYTPRRAHRAAGLSTAHFLQSFKVTMIDKY